MTQSSEPKRDNSCTSFPLKMNLEKRQADVHPILKEWSQSIGMAGTLHLTESVSLKKIAFIFHRARLTYEQTANFAPLQIRKAKAIC